MSRQIADDELLQGFIPAEIDPQKHLRTHAVFDMLIEEILRSRIRRELVAPAHLQRLLAAALHFPCVAFCIESKRIR